MQLDKIILTKKGLDMDTYSINLFPREKRTKYQPIIFFILGVIYIILGILYLSDKQAKHFYGFIWLITGLGFFVLSILNFYKKDKRILFFSDELIKANIDWNKKLSISWSDLKEIRINPVSIDLQLINGDIKSLSLDFCDYKTVLLVKEKMIEYAKSKNLEVH